MNAANHLTITICGDGGTGKSSIALRLVRSQWTGVYDPTIEDCYRITRKIDGKVYHISIADTAGQMEYRSMWAESSLNSDAFLLVYDITSQNSLFALKEFNALIDKQNEKRLKETKRIDHMQVGNPNLRSSNSTIEQGKTPINSIKLVVGNMCDLQHNRHVLAEMGDNWARKNNCSFIEISAKEELNIEEMLEMTVKKVVQARKQAATTREFGMQEANQRSNRKLIHFKSVERPPSECSVISLIKPLQLAKRETLFGKGRRKMARWTKWNRKIEQISGLNWRGCFQVH